MQLPESEDASDPLCGVKLFQLGPSDGVAALRDGFEVAQWPPGRAARAAAHRRPH